MKFSFLVSGKSNEYTKLGVGLFFTDFSLL